MRIPQRQTKRGIALIIVMVVILVLGALAAGFAYSMKVETTLARNVSFETELEWMARSAVEYARYVLALQAALGNEPYDSLNQKWAGGPGSWGSTNEILAQLSLDNVPLGRGQFSIKLIDQERKGNINTADKFILLQALTQMGVDSSETAMIIDSIVDWRDPDNDPQLSGWESDDYLRLEPPYVAKNAPIDDLTELLRIRGITPEMYWGPARTNSLASFNRWHQDRRQGWDTLPPSYTVGLVDLFCAISSRQINVNTASAQVLQLVPGLDPNVAGVIIRMRSGPDGADATMDDTPFRDPRQVPLATPDPAAASQIASLFTVRSLTFEVHIDVSIGDSKRQYIAMLRRASPRDVQTLYLYGK